MTTRYLDSEDFTKSFLNKYNTVYIPVPSYQVLADTFHDDINVLKKVTPRNTTVFEDKLLEYSKKDDITIKDLSFTEFVYADLDKNDSLQIEQKMKSELFVVDVFSGNYQIPGINNLLDCTANQNAKTVNIKLTDYKDFSQTRTYTNIFNCDKLLFSYFKKKTPARIQEGIGINLKENLHMYDDGTKKVLYNNLVNCFWKKLIEIVEILLFKDESILKDEYDLTKAIQILKKFEFSFNTENFKLCLKHNSEKSTGKSAEWVPTQKSLAAEIIKIGKNSGIATPNVKQREENIKGHQTDCIDAIKSYYENAASATQILVLSLCKFLGDTSHIVMAYILLHETKAAAEGAMAVEVATKEAAADGTGADGTAADETAVEGAAAEGAAAEVSAAEGAAAEGAVNKGTPIKINLQLSERPMLIRNCLPDTEVLTAIGIDDTHLESLIILVKKMKTLNTLITDESPSDKDDIDTKKCWLYTTDTKYNDKLNQQFLISLIEKLKTETDIDKFTIKDKALYKDYLEFNSENKIDNTLKQILTFLDIHKLKNVQLENVKNILTELYNLCIAKKVKDKYKENSHTKEILKIILEKMNESMVHKIRVVTLSRLSNKTVPWEHICKITKIEELEYFETLLNYNQSIKLLKTPTFFKGDESLDYEHTKGLLENQFLKNAIMTNDNNELGIKFEPATIPTATNYKIQNILQQILSIINIKPQEGGGKRVFASEPEPAPAWSLPLQVKSKKKTKTLQEQTVENIFQFFINELLTDIAKGIYNISTFTFNNEPFNKNIYKIRLPLQDNIDKIFSVAIFIEHSIDMFIYKIEKYINLNFYFDDTHIKSAVKALEQSVFKNYSNKYKYVDILSTIIIDKITLYLDNLDDTPYKNDDYGNVTLQINEDMTITSNITQDIKKDMDIIAGMILLRDNNNVLDMVVNTELKQRKGLDMPADDVVAKRDKTMVAEAARRSVEKLEADAARARANLS